MERLSTTPFGARPVSAGLLATQALAEADAPIAEFDKWELFRDLCVARQTFGVTDRDLAVLNALLSFHPKRALVDGDPLIVFPSNASLSERAHGMAESTLRRHLAVLVGAGLIARHDSPNGKRYAARNASGALVRAFGFDLRPLLVQAVDIAEAAEDARAKAGEIRRLREEITLLLRDAAKLSAFGMAEYGTAIWADLEERAGSARRVSRRKLDRDGLLGLRADLEVLLTEIEEVLLTQFPDKSKEMSGNDLRSERHYQNSKPNPSEFESCSEAQEGKVDDDRPVGSHNRERPKLPLALVLKACPEIQLYAKDGIRDWRDLVAAAMFVRGMIGISPDAWVAACHEMGDETAAIVVSAILERSAEITSAGGYLRALTTKAGQGAFSPGPMVMALLNRSDRAAA